MLGQRRGATPHALLIPFVPRGADRANPEKHGRFIKKTVACRSGKARSNDDQKRIAGVMENTHATVVVSRTPPPSGVVQARSHAVKLPTTPRAPVSSDGNLICSQFGAAIRGRGRMLQCFGGPTRCRLSRKPMADLHRICRSAGQTFARRNWGGRRRRSFGIWLMRPRA